MKKFMEKHFDTIEEALSKAREVKKFLSSLDYKNHLILKEVDNGFILEIWFKSQEN